jgi:hypothetical protein
MNLPFTQTVQSESFYIRKFSELTCMDELMWHRDEDDRTVTCKYHTDWMMQLENSLPIKIGETEIFIPANTWHRLIKGTGDLEVQIRINNKDE